MKNFSEIKKERQTIALSFFLMFVIIGVLIFIVVLHIQQARQAAYLSNNLSKNQISSLRRIDELQKQNYNDLQESNQRIVKYVKCIVLLSSPTEKELDECASMAFVPVTTPSPTPPPKKVSPRLKARQTQSPSNQKSTNPSPMNSTTPRPSACNPPQCLPSPPPINQVKE